MSFAESLLLLMLLSVLLLQLVRRVPLPYPTVLAAAGVVIAIIPGTPVIGIDPRTSLMVFVAPALLDAAFDFPLGTARRFWLPLVVLAVVGVVVSTAAVAALGVWIGGLPVAAAVVLGAIVSPPDAAAATAVLRQVAMPRSSATVLKGESLFNDATALLLFAVALAVQRDGGIGLGNAIRIGIAVPGGVLFGIVCARCWLPLSRMLVGTLGGVLMQFVGTMLVWDVADRLHLSAVLALVAYAMAIARGDAGGSRPHVRVHSYAVWATVVFVSNVLAFLLMGMQARAILFRVAGERLRTELLFAAAVLFCVVVVRLAVAIALNRLVARHDRRRGRRPRATLAQGVLVGWCGMRGLVTLAAARAQLAEAVLRRLEGEDAAEAVPVGHPYRMARDHHLGVIGDDAVERLHGLGREAVAVARRRLDELRAAHEIGDDGFDALQSELDWRELSMLSDRERRIEEN